MAPRNDAVVSATIELKRRALALGFDAVGIAPLEVNLHAEALDRWLEAGYAGTMTYMQRQSAKRNDPRLIMPAARTAVVTLTNYWHGISLAAADPGAEPRGESHLSSPGHRPGVSRSGTRSARVAQYAWSTDYHRIIGPRLEQLAAVIAELVPGSMSLGYVDAGPVPERDLAQRAGLGWIGKNTMLIDPAIGSFTFIGTVLTDAALDPDLPFDADRCGTCRACLDACPTDAFPEPHVLDARRCISYLTIERRDAFTAAERAQVGEWLFGCDVCQDVCPWNVRFARATSDEAFGVRPETAQPDPRELLRLDEATFASRYGDTAFERPGNDGLRRNALAVLENIGAAQS
jgi:epoxyqueuosine reductase